MNEFAHKDPPPWCIRDNVLCAKGKMTMFPIGVLDDVIDALEGVKAEL